ncbi:uncharacterized protein LOC128662550 isoform X3 [Bombina bombina]|uniref:uncharacterized protein LOC128662550 isoform X3 n=1 Tax=Bombina bombina TaxID=8345 RepID=UPI00235AB853|nr:uncharacterized protein LOC128662550 isoform X3 [Bombina bombina]
MGQSLIQPPAPCDNEGAAKLPRIRDKAAPRKRTKGSTYAANLTDQGKETASQDQRTDESQTTCLQVYDSRVYDSVPPDITQLPTAAGNRHSSELHNMEQNLSGESEQKKSSSHCLVNMTCLNDTGHQETYALPKYLYHDQNKEPLYMDPEKNPQVILMKEVPPYKDEQYMYAFHYGNVQFYLARMTENKTYTGKLADRVDRMSLRIWGEVFGALRILISPFMFFVNELSAFLFTYIFQVLVVGLLSTLGDHVLKPLMVALFNNILQPIFTFLLNIMSSLQALLVPLWNLFNGFAQVLATVVRSFRLVEIHTGPMIYSKPVKEV